MADDRPVLTDVEQIAAMQRQIDDLRSTVLARAGRSPTGTVEPTILPAPKPDTLFMQGQIVSRTTYPALWQWVRDNNLLQPGLFGPADGSTTFGLPDFRGRVPVGAGTLAVGALVGADSVSLSVAQMPAHSHTINAVGDHQHQRTGNNRNTNATGSHNGHFNGQQNNPPYQTVFPGTNYISPSDLLTPTPAHSHTVDAGDPDGGHSHSAQNTGSGTAIDVRQASIAIGWLIWT